MAGANLSKSKFFLTSATTASNKYLRGPESALIEISSFRPHLIKFTKTAFYLVNLASQCSRLDFLLSKFGSEREGISIDADSRPLEYVL